MLKAFSAYPLSEENVQKITTEYITKLQAAMAIQTKIKKDDAEHPIVEGPFYPGTILQHRL